MESIRQNKVARLMQKELGQYFQQDGAALAPGAMITVTTVRMTPDLALAKVFLSVFPSGKSDDAMALINQSTKSIRYHIAKIVRHQLRIVPDLMFFLDDSLDYAEKIDNLLK